jgi:hypothetical protein
MAAATAEEGAPAKKAEEEASGHQRESSGRNPGGLPTPGQGWTIENGPMHPSFEKTCLDTYLGRFTL